MYALLLSNLVLVTLTHSIFSIQTFYVSMHVFNLLYMASCDIPVIHVWCFSVITWVEI